MIVVTLDGDVTIYLEGPIDVASARALWDHLAEAIPEAKERLVIDLSGTTFLDSRALNLFVRAHKQLRAAGAEIVLRRPNELVSKTLQITGLDKVFTVEN